MKLSLSRLMPEVTGGIKINERAAVLMICGEMSDDDRASIHREVIHRINTYDQSLTALWRAFDALRCYRVTVAGICGTDTTCYGCLAKLEVVAALEAAEKGAE